MKCPFCSTEIAEQTGYCPNCGQSIVNMKSDTYKVDEFWDETGKKDKQRYKQHKDIVDERLHLEKSKTHQTIAIGITAVIVCIAIIFGVYCYSTSSAKQMETVKASLHGNSFSCYYVTAHWFSTYHHYCTLQFNNDGTLRYYEAYDNDDEKELKGTYSYTISRSMGGKYTVLFSDMKFELKITSDYQVNAISYDD